MHLSYINHVSVIYDHTDINDQNIKHTLTFWHFHSYFNKLLLFLVSLKCISISQNTVLLMKNYLDKKHYQTRATILLVIEILHQRHHHRTEEKTGENCKHTQPHHQTASSFHDNHISDVNIREINKASVPALSSAMTPREKSINRKCRQ